MHGEAYEAFWEEGYCTSNKPTWRGQTSVRRDENDSMVLRLVRTVCSARAYGLAQADSLHKRPPYLYEVTRFYDSCCGNSSAYPNCAQDALKTILAGHVTCSEWHYSPILRLLCRLRRLRLRWQHVYTHSQAKSPAPPHC